MEPIEIKILNSIVLDIKIIKERLENVNDSNNKILLAADEYLDGAIRKIELIASARNDG